MWKDEIVEDTRKAREEYAAKFNYDLEAILRDLKKQEAQNQIGNSAAEQTPPSFPFSPQDKGDPKDVEAELSRDRHL